MANGVQDKLVRIGFLGRQGWRNGMGWNGKLFFFLFRIAVRNYGTLFFSKYRTLKSTIISNDP